MTSQHLSIQISAAAAATTTVCHQKWTIIHYQKALLKSILLVNTPLSIQLLGHHISFVTLTYSSTSQTNRRRKHVLASSRGVLRQSSSIQNWIFWNALRIRVL